MRFVCVSALCAWGCAVATLTPRPPSIWRLTFLSLSERLRKSKLPSRLQRFCDAATQIVLPP